MFSSPTISDCVVVDPYNTLLTIPSLVEHTDLSLLLDNEALYGICRDKLRTDNGRITCRSLNELIAKAVSSITVSLRFEGDVNWDLNEMQSYQVVYHRLCFMVTSMAPVRTESNKETNDIRSITENCFAAQNYFAKIPDFDVTEDNYWTISLHYRGHVKAKEAFAAARWIDEPNKRVCFVDWGTAGFKCGLNKNIAAQLEDDRLGNFERSVVMMGQNYGIHKFFRERVCRKYDKMYSQRAFVHWYLEEGMEESDFDEAREDLESLEQDYLNVLWEPATDEEDDDDSENES